jgi:hypothetical protein
MNNYGLQGSATKSFRAHVLKFGGEIRVIQFNTLQTDDASTRFKFTSAFTQGPDPTRSTSTAGDALATFLLGIPTGSVTPSPALALESCYNAGFVEDPWRVTINFSLDLGFRYELGTPLTERYNRLTNFNYSAVRP